ncbi:hypothetical protein AAH978_19555 [Streptomyces sp. ZYX-F-203]
MPLRFPPPPSPALRSVLVALASPTAVRGARTSSLPRAEGPLAPDLPLPVHTLERVSAEGTPVTRLTGWRFLIRGGGVSIAAAETTLTPDGWAFSHFFEGPYVSATERALRRAEEAERETQPRLLSVPGLYMLALWLHHDGGADAATGHPDPTDLLVPLAPAPPGIVADRPRPVTELLPVLTARHRTGGLLGSPA